MTTTDIPTIDVAKRGAFVRHAVVDKGAAISGLPLDIGDWLGLHKAMTGPGPEAGAGPVARPPWRKRTGTSERYVRRRLGNQAA